MTNRQYALKLVNKSLADLPDSYTLCDGLDELEQMIEEADEFTPMSELLDMAQEVASNMLEDEGMDCSGYEHLLGEANYIM